MNKRQTRLFAIVATGISAAVFLLLTFDSHRKFDALTNAESITPAVVHGKDVWHKNNCINCHTIFGEGAYYAPDLTKITKLRGEAYLKAYLKDPSKFYDEQRHRRLMPKQDLSDEDIAFACLIMCRYGELTIGAPTSPAITNAMMFDFDVAIGNFAKELDQRISKQRFDHLIEIVLVGTVHFGGNF